MCFIVSYQTWFLFVNIIIWYVNRVKYAVNTETNEAVAIKILDKDKIQTRNMGIFERYDNNKIYIENFEKYLIMILIKYIL